MLKFKNIVLMILGNLLLAYSVQAFTVPYNIPVSGVTGLALILSHSLFLATLFSGLISGIGVGLVLKVKASTGGLDIVSIVLVDKLNLNVSLIMHLIDTLLMIGQLFFIDFISIFYGILGALIMTRMIHKIIH